MAEPKPFNMCLLYILIGLMILTGSINTIFNKILQKLESKGILFEQHHWIITFGMFIGESVSLIGYTIVVIKRKKKKVSEEKGETLVKSEEDDENEDNKKPQVPTNLIFALSASCDLMATTINTFGLTYLTTSMYQMLRGFELIFVCAWSTIFLKNPVYRHQVLGLSTLIIGLVLVGVNSIINKEKDKGTAKDPGTGIILMFCSQFFSSTCYVLQEKFIKHYRVNPFQLVGFEGLWGICMYTVLLVIFQHIKCNNWKEGLKTGVCFGSDDPATKRDWYIEDSIFAFQQMGAYIPLLIVYIFYIVSIALYNIVGINLTKLVSSTARAVVDTVRTVFIWAFFLFVHPVKGTEENFYIIQFIGFILLVVGTLIYNEIVEIPLCELNKFTRNEMAKREKEKREKNDDYDDENNTTKGLFPNYSNNNTTDPYTSQN